MRKSVLFLFCLLSSMFAKADEGMWTLYNLPKAVYDQMKAEGYSLPYNALYWGDNAIKNSVISFCGYCSGVVVSPDGLVFTNHHCGFESIRSHSTVEHDYMRDGFVAKSFEEELPNKDMYVSFLVSQEDITYRLEALGFDEMDYHHKSVLLDSLTNVLTKEAKRLDKSLHVEIDPYYEGNKYYASTYRMFTDIRLVFAVPKSMGKFGGDTDNWMWPRQTCDFSVFRIYADPKTNGPAAYSKDNVPYKPESWAKVSMNGYKEGDFAMTIGYPGSTSRYLSSYGIKERRDASNAPRVQVRGLKQEIMKRHMEAKQDVRIKYDSKYAQSSNYWKNSIGMNKCIDSIGIIQQKQEYEKSLVRWQKKTGYLEGKLDFALMEKLYAERFDRMRAFYYWIETFNRTNELVDRSMQVVYAAAPAVEGGEAPSITFKDNSDEWDEALDKDVYAALLKNYAENVDAKYLPSFFETIQKKFRGNYKKYVNTLYAKSVLMKSGKKIMLQDKKVKEDLGVMMGFSLTEFIGGLQDEISEINKQIDKQEKYLCAAKLRMEEDMPHYSDANSTLRLSYGQVGGFNMGGRPSGYYTTAESMVEKMMKGDSFKDYQVEPIMKDLLGAKDFGKYTDPMTGKMQLCFLTNNDITGGNSGSAMFNGKNELIGLAFDGNWDSLSNDIFFDRTLARCIGIDIRYVLYMMDKWGHADRLVNEIFREK